MGRRTEAVREWIYNNRLKMTVVTLILLGLFVLLSDRIVVVIRSGQVGVRFSRLTGTDKKHVYAEGLTLILPWDQMFIYDSRLQQREDTIIMYANDGLELRIRLSTQYHIPHDQVTRLHETVGPDYERKLVHPDVVAAVRSVIGNYNESDIYATDERGILDDLKKTAALQSSAVQYDGIKILSLLVPDSIQHAIQSKLAQQQIAQAQNYRILAAKGEAQRKAVEAEGYADFARISGIPALRLREIEAAEVFARSPNAKLILFGGGTGQFPLLLNKEVP